MVELTNSDQAVINDLAQELYQLATQLSGTCQSNSSVTCDSVDSLMHVLADTRDKLRQYHYSIVNLSSKVHLLHDLSVQLQQNEVLGPMCYERHSKRILVSSTINSTSSTVREFRLDHSFVQQFSVPKKIYSIAANFIGEIFVGLNGYIDVYNVEGVKLRRMKLLSKFDHDELLPIGITFDDQDIPIVLQKIQSKNDSYVTVALYDIHLKLLNEFRVSSNDLTDIAVNKEDIIYVSSSNDVSVFNAEGKLLKTLTLPKSEHPIHIAAIDLDKEERLYVKDTANELVYLFSKSGDHLAQFKQGGVLHGISD
jgi:hypothetical protein